MSERDLRSVRRSLRFIARGLLPPDDLRHGITGWEESATSSASSGKSGSKGSQEDGSCSAGKGRKTHQSPAPAPRGSSSSASASASNDGDDNDEAEVVQACKGQHFNVFAPCFYGSDLHCLCLADADAMRPRFALELLKAGKTEEAQFVLSRYVDCASRATA